MFYIIKNKAKSKKNTKPKQILKVLNKNLKKFLNRNEPNFISILWQNHLKNDFEWFPVILKHIFGCVSLGRYSLRIKGSTKTS